MKISKWSLFLVTSICAFSGCNKGSSGKKTTTASLPPSTSEPAPYENVYPDYDKHYSGYNFQNQIGNNLQFELHKYFIEKHGSAPVLLSANIKGADVHNNGLTDPYGKRVH